MSATDFFEESTVDLKVNDLKQYCYCPRIVFYHYVMPVDKKETYKMIKGKVAHERIQQLEERRKLRRYHLKGGRKSFDVPLYSRKYGLSGKVDMVIEMESECFPVEFKWTDGKVQRNHIIQLAAYALLIEEKYRKPVLTGFLYSLPQDDVVPCSLTDAVKAECLGIVQEIVSMIREERFPDPPREIGKCFDCEYRNFCRDVW